MRKLFLLIPAGPFCAVLVAACGSDAPLPTELKDETSVSADVTCASPDYGSACAQRCDDEGAVGCAVAFKHPYNHKAGLGLLSGCSGLGGVPTECRFYYLTTGGSCVWRLGRATICSP